MIYTPITRRAMNLAYKSLEGQYDREGVPFVYHPIHIAEQMLDEDTTATALMHDNVVGTDYTVDDLRKEGFSERICKAVELLKHEPGVSYKDYIVPIRYDDIAREVKLADMAHNTRILKNRSDTTPEEQQKLADYKAARDYLLSNRFKCPCCGYYTLNAEAGASYGICPVCFWEDDPRQLQDYDMPMGLNAVSLNEAKKNFEEIGACMEKMIPFTRNVYPSEIDNFGYRK